MSADQISNTISSEVPFLYFTDAASPAQAAVSSVSESSAALEYFSAEAEGGTERSPTPATGKSVPASLQKRISKTKVCIHNLSGRCTRGSKCSFAHSMQELKDPPDLYKTRLCIAWTTTGTCPKGDSCRFAHGDTQLRSTPEFYKTSLCPYWQTATNSGCAAGDKCRWAHGAHEVRQRGASSDAPSASHELQPVALYPFPSIGNMTTTCASPGENSNSRQQLVASPIPPPPPLISPGVVRLNANPPPPPPLQAWRLGTQMSFQDRPIDGSVELLQFERQRLLEEERQILLKQNQILRDRAANEEMRRQLEVKSLLLQRDFNYSAPVGMSPAGSDIDLDAIQTDLSSLPTSCWNVLADANTSTRVRANTDRHLSPARSSFATDFAPRFTFDSLETAKRSVDASQVMQLLGDLGASLGNIPCGRQSGKNRSDYPSFGKEFCPTESGLDSMEWDLTQALQEDPSASQNWIYDHNRRSSASTVNSRCRAASSVSFQIPVNETWSGDEVNRKSLKPTFLKASSSMSTADSDIAYNHRKGSTLSYSSIATDDIPSRVNLDGLNWPFSRSRMAGSNEKQVMWRYDDKIQDWEHSLPGKQHFVTAKSLAIPNEPAETTVSDTSLQDMLRTILKE